MIIVINDENVVEVQFRLDFAHWTPPNLELQDPDEIEILPDLVWLFKSQAHYAALKLE